MGYEVSRPFRRGDHIYATDQRIVVRMPLPAEEIEGLGTGRVPPVESQAWDVSLYRERASDLPEIPPPSVVPCRCVEDFLHGDTSSCEDCGGTGEVLQYTEVQIEDMWFSSLYLDMLAATGAQLYLPLSGICPARFAGEGFEGLLMNCGPPEDMR